MTFFLDTLSPGDRQAALDEMRRLVCHIDGFLTFSQDYRQRMAELFEIPSERIHVVPLGLASPEDFFDGDGGDGGRDGVQRDDPRPPTLGYLARLCPEKGFHHLVDAFLDLRQRPQTTETRLLFGGWLGAGGSRLLRGTEWERFNELGQPTR